jgi:DNA replication protein DnaC
VNELLEAKRAGRFTLLMRQLKKIDILILDELGYITFDLEGAELLFQILAARYEIHSTVITTNLPFSEWIKVFHDKTLTAALLDRITHRAIVVNMNGSSYRRRASKSGPETSPREGGMFTHPTEPIVLRSGLKGGGEASSLLCFSSE